MECLIIPETPLLQQLYGSDLLKMWMCLANTLDSCLLTNSGGKKLSCKRTQGEFVEVKPSIQHIFDGRLPATALLDLKAPLSARAGIKKHFHTSHSNQSLLFLTTMKAFMLTRHCDQSFIHTFKRD